MRRHVSYPRRTAVRRVVATAAAGSLLAISPLMASAQTSEGVTNELTGRAIVLRVNERSFGKSAAHLMLLRMRSPKGHQRERGLVTFRDFAPGASQLAFYVTSPPNMRNRSYLVYDYLDATKSDDQWIYTPKRATPRRIADTNRKESFLGSEFTLEDVKKVFRIEVDDYEWELRAKRDVDGHTLYEVEQRPRTAELAKQLGVSRMRSLIDSRYWVRIAVETWDLDGQPFKLFKAETADGGDGGASSIRKILARNLQTGAESEIVFQHTRVGAEIPAWVFTTRGMKREDVGALEKLASPRGA
jgi:hypothetical protein